MANTVKDLKDFFSTPEKPVDNKEMVTFWRSLSEDEKAYYQEAALS
jgi:hypothetical protein